MYASHRVATPCVLSEPYSATLADLHLVACACSLGETKVDDHGRAKVALALEHEVLELKVAVRHVLQFIGACGVHVAHCDSYDRI